MNQPSASHDQPAVCSGTHPSAGSASQTVQPCDATKLNADCEPDDSPHKQRLSMATADTQPPVAGLCTAPTNSEASTAAPVGSTEKPIQQQGAAHETYTGNLSRPTADLSLVYESLESRGRPAALLSRALEKAERSPAARETVAKDHVELQAGGMSLADVASLTHERTDTVTAESKGTNKLSPADDIPARHESIADMRIDPKADGEQPAGSASTTQRDLEEGEVQRKDVSMPPAHRRQLSGQSSKGSALSGNPYASSCGGSPAGSQEISEHSQAQPQQAISGEVLTCFVPVTADLQRCWHALTVYRRIAVSRLHRIGRVHKEHSIHSRAPLQAPCLSRCYGAAMCQQIGGARPAGAPRDEAHPSLCRPALLQGTLSHPREPYARAQ